MTFDDYQTAAATTAIYPPEVGLAYVAMGLAGEAGEVANKVKKIYRDKGGKAESLDRHAIACEIGDVLWYCAMLAREIGYELETVAEINVQKLSTRAVAGTLGGAGDSR